MTKEEALNFLTELATEIKNQNNRGTAIPYFYAVQKNRKLVTDPDYGYNERVFRINEDQEDPYTEEELETMKNEDISEEEFEEQYGFKKEEIDKILDGDSEISETLYLKDNWETKGVFFTEKAADEHIEDNLHHYGYGEENKVRTYVMHFWRNPEIEKLFDAISALTGVCLKH